MAQSLDTYGDHYEETASSCDGSFTHNADPDMNKDIAFLNGDDAWHGEIAEINGSQFYQVRITWQANPLTGLTPELSSFALAWAE